MSEAGSDEFTRIENKLVMLAVDSSLESRGAVMWAARSLINPRDEVVIFHAIKALKEIPTASECSSIVPNLTVPFRVWLGLDPFSECSITWVVSWLQ